jgi:hypothetical protein
MMNEQKAGLIKSWENQEERMTFDFHDAQGLNVQIAGCTNNVAHLIFQEVFPHMKERVTIPLRKVEVDGNPFHYNRDPTVPIHNRLRLRIDQNRSPD